MSGSNLYVSNCSQLVSLAGPARPRVGSELRELSIINDGAMIVRDGKVSAVGSRAEIESQVTPELTEVDAQGGVVMPGFVDAHAHPVFGGKRCDEYEKRAAGVSYKEIAEAGGGIRSTVAATQRASLDELVKAGKRYAQWFLRGGTTTLEAKSGYGLSFDDEIKMLRAIRRLDESTPIRYVPTFLGAHTVPAEYAEQRAKYLDLVVDEMIPEVAKQGLARYCDVFCESIGFDYEESRRVLQAAKDQGLGLRIHADQLSLCGGAKLAAELGAKTADHLEQADLQTIQMLKQAHVQPVVLPGSVYALGHTKYPDGRAMIDEGLAIVLATDFNPGSSPTPSMSMMLSLASTHMKMTPAEAVSAATINAAYSLDLGDEVGSLEQGKQADFVVWDVKDYREIAYFFGVEHASAVFAGGQEVFKRA